jgi:hypothetical protein
MEWNNWNNLSQWFQGFNIKLGLDDECLPDTVDPNREIGLAVPVQMDNGQWKGEGVSRLSRAAQSGARAFPRRHRLRDSRSESP